MERVTGIGGVFFRAKDPAALSEWYDKHLGIYLKDDDDPWWPDRGPTFIQPFRSAEEFFGMPEHQTSMLNFRVRDLDAMLAQLREQGADVDDHISTTSGPGRYGWVTDPEGNRVELWEPSPDMLEEPARYKKD
ncbi:hypothetical protein BBK82_30940 [Lentzea guizhouensis]|uniref:VOC domain-containing protein n=1 Tax=Lentzea guizhouensis TaxID=1586287 RepID=A0A1B2HQ14_9PSEU|nr:VOC family protein [Lentzea guizhouensis]ANZ39803.1 hypothetical protein BBK82_30940 [Lentzea guizhouensis]